MVNVEYLRPRTLNEVLSMLSKYGEEAKIIAGGTDLMVRLKQETASPDYLIAIESLQELNYIRYDEDGLRIGALTKFHDIANSSIVRDKFPILHQAVSVLGTPLIRRQATIGGNLCNASPCADTGPPLLVLGARVKICAAGEEKSIPVEDLFIGPGQTCLDQNEMLTEIHIPPQNEGSKGIYLKMTRSHGADLAIVSVAASVLMDGDIAEEAKIALGSVALTPIRARNAEKLLSGNRLDTQLLDKSAQSAAMEAKPIDDVRSSSDHRKKIIKALVGRAIKQAADLEI